MLGPPNNAMIYLSLSARRAWIEIPPRWAAPAYGNVALRKESVDRNKSTPYLAYLCIMSLSARRAWIEIIRPCPAGGRNLSLSARRAWIEIYKTPTRCSTRIVALRKESVDRNFGVLDYERPSVASLSARRAWIEMCLRPALIPAQGSLSARRAWIEIFSSCSSAAP